jgi:arylsulfatase A-like enzyme
MRDTIPTWSLSVIIALFVATCSVFGEIANKPNILLIVADDEDRELIASYGGRVETPHLDSLGQQGVRFTNANVVHTICSPSRYAILTGRYYDNSTGAAFLKAFPHGAPSSIDNFIEIENDGMNLQSVLRANGYYTAHIGKYHLTGHHLLYLPIHWEKAGLQTYAEDADPRIDAEVNAKMKANHEWWRERIKQDGFDFTDAVYAANVRELFNNHLNVHNIEWTTDAAVRFLRTRQGEAQPFYLAYNTTYPHGPKPEWKRRGGYPFSIDADVQLTGEGYVTDRDLSEVLAGETRESVKRFLDHPDYCDRAAFATWWDAGVGALINTLKETGQYENTLIVYISDHGLHNSGKSTVYETGVHVPMFMQWPARFAGGREYDPVVGSIDLAPTVFEAVGVRVPDGYYMDGISLLPVLEGSNEPVREALLLQMGYAHAVKTDGWKYIAVRYPEKIEQMLDRGEVDPKWTHPGWKQPPQPYLIQHIQLANWSYEKNPHYFARNQLFDLKNDPGEQHNLFAEMPEKAAEMKALLSKAFREHLPHRPFGEFHLTKNPAAFRNSINAIWHPSTRSSEGKEP